MFLSVLVENSTHSFVIRTALLERRLRAQGDPLDEIGLNLNPDDEVQQSVTEIELDLTEDSIPLLTMTAPNVTSSPEALLASTTSGTIPKLTQAELYEPKPFIIQVPLAARL